MQFLNPIRILTRCIFVSKHVKALPLRKRSIRSTSSMSFPLWLEIVSFKQLFNEQLFIKQSRSTWPQYSSWWKKYKISFQRLAYKLTRVQIRPYIKSSSYINKKVATEWLNFEILEPSAVKKKGSFRREISHCSMVLYSFYIGYFRR